MAWGVFYRPTSPSHYDREYGMQSMVSPSYVKEYPSYSRRRFGPTASANSDTQPPPFSCPALTYTGTPRFKVPLSDSILEDPAFSSDPRTHPHFPLANAGSFRVPPPKPRRPPPYQSSQALPRLPRDTPILQEVNMPVPYGPPKGPLSSPPSSPSPPPSSSSVSLESDSHPTLSSFTSPSASSARSFPPSPKQAHGDPISAPVSPIPPSTPCFPPMLSRDAIIAPSPSPPVLGPELQIPTKLDRPFIPAKTNQVLLPLKNKKNVPRNGRMRNLVRRFTNRHQLDRIDELDETGPFGGSYHHGGPYEVISSNLAELGPPHKYNDIEVLRGSVHDPKRKLFAPSSRYVQHQSTPQTSSPNTEAGLSLHLEPGQILQKNTIYTPPVSGIGSIPVFFRRQPDPPARATRSDHSRSQSLPRSLTHLRGDPSLLDSPNGFQSSASPRGPRIHYFGDNIPRISNSLLSCHHDHDAAPYALHQAQTTSLPPPQYESASPKSALPQFAIVSQPVPPNPTSQQTPAMDSAVSAFPPRAPRHRVTHSLDNPGTVNRAPTHSSSSTQDRPLEPPRIRHLPKRLVMPAPLQPQSQESQHEFPPINPPIVYDEYPDDLSDSRFEGEPAIYNQGRRLLRKRSSAFPAKIPIPEHVPMSQGNAVPVIENPSAKADNGVERTKEGGRRRRLSKRKNDN